MVLCGDREHQSYLHAQWFPSDIPFLEQENELLEAARYTYRTVEPNILLWEKFVTDHNEQVISKIRQCGLKIKTSAKRGGKRHTKC